MKGKTMSIHFIRKTINRIFSTLLVLLTVFLAACGPGPDARPTTAKPAAPVATAVSPTDISPTGTTSPTAVSALTDVQVSITGGDDLDPRDHGRPVVLIAAALGVPADVFREAFSHVKPAGAGQEPDPAQVQLNKQALLKALGPYGVTNDRLDTVSNYYRYNGRAGETWPRIPATATVIMTDGVITGFTITNPGSGYTSAPTVSITGAGDVTATATISFSTDFKTNGSLSAITLDAKK
jgi:hypothetical protein